jgi:hypothetical protein
VDFVEDPASLALFIRGELVQLIEDHLQTRTLSFPVLLIAEICEKVNRAEGHHFLENNKKSLVLSAFDILLF